MEALIFDKKSLSLQYTKNRPIPQLENDNDVIVEVEYAGICGTDVHIIEGAFPCKEQEPFVMGHEFVGLVVKAGSKASFKPGQRVVVDPNSGCNVCYSCHIGNYHLCKSGGINNTVGIFRNGGWARYCMVPDTQVLSLPDGITPQQGALTEPISCLAHGWDRAGRIFIGQSVLVMGAGIIGMLWAELFHLQGHKNVVISEPNKDRLHLAKNIGLGYECITPNDIQSQERAFDVIVDCTGVAAAMESSLPLLNPAGRYVVFGCANPNATAKINPFQIYHKEATIIGVMVNPFTFPKAIGLLQSMGESGCNVCYSCHIGNYHLCKSGGINNTVGIFRNGGWARYCMVPDTQVLSLPDGITPQQGALTEPISCLAHGWDRAGRIFIGQSVLVMGAGIIGMLWAELFHLQGHKNVVISEPNKDRLHLAKNIGLGYECITPNDIQSQERAFDVIVDCTGVAAAMESSLPLLNPAGRYVVFGCANPNATAKINPFQIYHKEATIIGVMVNPFTFPKAIGLLQSMGERYIDYEKLGISVFPLSNYEEAFKELKKGTISKAVFKF